MDKKRLKIYIREDITHTTIASLVVNINNDGHLEVDEDTTKGCCIIDWDSGDDGIGEYDDVTVSLLISNRIKILPID